MKRKFKFLSIIMTIIIVMSYSSTSFASNKNEEIESELKVLENEKIIF